MRRLFPSFPIAKLRTGTLWRESFASENHEPGYGIGDSYVNTQYIRSSSPPGDEGFTDCLQRPTVASVPVPRFADRGSPKIGRFAV